jgi:hypothetical protein
VGRDLCPRLDHAAQRLHVHATHHGRAGQARAAQ